MPDTTSPIVNERARHLDTLAATPAALKAALRGVPRKLLLFTPAPGKWSILEILCHLRDMEREGYLERYTRILAENEPRLPDLNGDALAIERDYRGQKAGDVLRDWARLRRESLRLLKKSKPEQWRRAGIHETAGRLTIDDLVVRHAVGNDTAHLAQIDAVKRRAALLERLSAAPTALAAALKGVPDDEVVDREPARGFVDSRAPPLLGLRLLQEPEALAAQARPVTQDVSRFLSPVVALDREGVAVQVGKARLVLGEDARVPLEVPLALHVAQVAQDLEDRPFPRRRREQKELAGHAAERCLERVGRGRERFEVAGAFVHAEGRRFRHLM